MAPQSHQINSAYSLHRGEINGSHNHKGFQCSAINLLQADVLHLHHKVMFSLAGQWRKDPLVCFIHLWQASKATRHRSPPQSGESFPAY